MLSIVEKAPEMKVNDFEGHNRFYENNKKVNEVKASRIGLRFYG